MRPSTSVIAALAALTVAVTSAACSKTPAPAESPGGRMPVAAAFYPLQFAAEKVGGTYVTVTGITKPGVEPHDLELTPKDVAGFAKSTVIVYEAGFQPAVDGAVKSIGGDAAYDVSKAARLTLTATEDGHDHGSTATPSTNSTASATATADAPKDPHFWLDPLRYGEVATALAQEFGAKDPANAAAYTENAKAFVASLQALDAEFTTGLSACKSKDLVTGHAAFGYLAERYGFHQEAIAGVSPDAEPTAAAMKVIAEHIKEHGVKTVYAETLVSPALAETIAKETGATVAVLDPIEGVTDSSAGKDYLEIMRSNLATLKKGQECS